MVLPLIFVDVAPRVGGLGAKFFSGTHAGKRVPIRASHVKAGSKPFRYPAHELGSAALVGGGFKCSCANPRASCVGDGELIPISMTIALLASSRVSLHPSS